jgi:ribonuclease HI
MDELTIYTDGGSRSEGASSSFVLETKGEIEAIAVYYDKATNNEAELLAIIGALMFHIQCSKSYQAKRALVIKTDSKYCIGCAVDWREKWILNNYISSKGNKVENIKLVKTLHNLVDMVNDQYGGVVFTHVKGHSGNRLNELADEYCTQSIDTKLSIVNNREYSIATHVMTNIKTLLNQNKEEKKKEETKHILTTEEIEGTTCKLITMPEALKVEGDWIIFRGSPCKLILN